MNPKRREDIRAELEDLREFYDRQGLDTAYLDGDVDHFKNRGLIYETGGGVLKAT